MTIDEYRRRMGMPPRTGKVAQIVQRGCPDVKQEAETPVSNPALPPKGLPRMSSPKMNKTEERFKAILEDRRRAGEFKVILNHAITLRLADGLRYTPDFFGQHQDGSLWIWEVKGRHVWDDALAKFKMAKTMFPCFIWVWAQYTKEHGWIEK